MSLSDEGAIGASVAAKRRRRSEEGFVLIIVLTSLALIAFVAGLFAQRVDQLRQQARLNSDYAEGQRLALEAQATGLYWLTTRSGTFDGFGEGRDKIRADGTPYALAQGSHLAVADQSAFISLNNLDRVSMDRVLTQLGAGAQLRDGLLDVLLDAVDVDDLRRLNGAEAQDYRRLGLPPPRNDWLLNVGELSRMPSWRDHPDLAVRTQALSSARLGSLINGNLAPLEVIRAMIPNANDEQLRLFDTLRRAQPFVYGSMAQAATGLALDGNPFVFFVSDEQTLTVWAPGLPRAIQYSLRLTPEGLDAPWRISEIHSVATGQIAINAEAATFPLKFADGKSN